MYWKRNSKGKIKKIEGKGPRKLNKLLETLYAEVKDKNWDDFEPDSLRVMMAALDRQLNEQGYKFSIIRERKFHSSKQILEIKPSSSSLVHLVLEHCNIVKTIVWELTSKLGEKLHQTKLWKPQH